MIRYYEQIGLLAAPARMVGGQRRYDWRDVDRLRFIRHARAFGFSLGVIRALLKLRTKAAPRQCEEAHEIVRDQLRTVEREISNLSALRAELRRMIDLCGEDAAEECHVIEVLGDHSLWKRARGKALGSRALIRRPQSEKSYANHNKTAGADWPDCHFSVDGDARARANTEFDSCG